MRNRGRRNLALLVGILAILGIAFVSATAQIGDEDPCRNSCREAQAQCVSVCGQHSNPIECESRCRDEFHDCERACR